MFNTRSVHYAKFNALIRQFASTIAICSESHKLAELCLLHILLLIEFQSGLQNFAAKPGNLFNIPAVIILYSYKYIHICMYEQKFDPASEVVPPTNNEYSLYRGLH